MAVIYRTAGPWGAGKGANLVAGEVDGNFYDVDRRVQQLADIMPPASVGIAFFSISGNLFYVHMTDGTIQGPFALPTRAWNFRGDWLPSTSYAVDDVVTANGSVWLVLVNHMSGTVFNSGANDGLGRNFYGQLLTNPSNVLPQGGDIGQYLTKTSEDDYVVGWQTPIIFPSQQLLEAPNATYALTLNNIASYVRCVNGSGCTIIIQPDTTLNFPLSTEISFRQCTGASVTLTPATGVALNVIDGLSPKTARNGAVITAKKVNANSWDVFGYLSV